MSHRFFKNSVPTASVYLSGMGVWIKFTQVADNVGVLAVSREDAIKDLLSAASEGISGIEEICLAEYEALSQKKTEWTASPPRWREELSLDEMRRAAERSASKPKLSVENGRADAVAVNVKQIEQSQLPSEHRPVVRRRVK